MASTLVFKVPNQEGPYALLNERDSFGIPEVDLASAPERFWSGVPAPAPVEWQLDRLRVDAIPTPCEALSRPLDAGAMAMSRQSLARAWAWLLVCGDPQRRLEATAVQPLSHQASLVAHVLERPELSRVLIADEVGLGKTIEAALIVRQLLERAGGLRVLYLAPARLVHNVQREFTRLGLRFRRWSAGLQGDARIEEDDRVIASIHRASHGDNLERVLGARPWDVIVVDECHHITDWAEGGGKPVRKYTLVARLIENQGPDGRVILLSGTPHQGHRSRFENLLRLLRRPHEPEALTRGRVIYRTKEDVRDWEGRPLFPGRQVREPIVVDLGAEHRAWLEHIHDLYVPPTDVKQARRRASGWRCAQALQWATSSVEAGLGYLVRQAIRVGWTPTRGALRDALAALRPYRQGPADEAIPQLFGRIQAEVARQQAANDDDDLEEVEEEEPSWRPDAGRLEALLREGVTLLHSVGDTKWRVIDERILRASEGEPVVLFAQPIETVTALARYLERAYNERPALIMGGQSDEEREAEVGRFTARGGPRFLVSSRAGGEGINLQVARRLVHVDVPWNPMEMEQRIGRVHRFGSRRTILVDTLVVRDSREVDALRVARQKLYEIAHSLVPEDRFEALFGRVMSLIPPQELQEVLTLRALAPLDEAARRRLSELVTEGFNQWHRFHELYGVEQRRIAALNPGDATWEDLQAFITDHLSGAPAAGFRSLRFTVKDDQVVERPVDARVMTVRAKDGSERRLLVEDHGGMPVTDDAGNTASPAGTNSEEIAVALRRLGLGEGITGAAWLRGSPEVAWPAGCPALPFIALLAGRVTLRFAGAAPVHEGATLRAVVVDREGRGHEVNAGGLLRALRACGVRSRGEVDGELLRAARGVEETMSGEWRRPTVDERSARRGHGVFPLLAAVVTP